MPSANSRAITFIVPGQEQPVETATRGAGPAPLPIELSQGRIKQSVRVSAPRGDGGEVQVTAVPGEDVVILQLASGPALTLHPETARDLMLAQGETRRSRGADGKREEPPANQVRVPAELEWRGLEQDTTSRGGPGALLGRVVLEGIQIVTGLLRDPAVNFLASQVVKRVDAQVNAGVYPLSPDALPSLKGATPARTVPTTSGGGPVLVLIHGTFSTTSGTFGNLWIHHPERVRALFRHYGNQVYALDHPTLGSSPITNALTLVQALRKNARLHLLTHSRGGLVAEVLARVCADPNVTNDALGLFSGDAYRDERRDLAELARLVRAKGIRVERIVRVACPARGTLLASKRLDAYLSVFRWTLQLAGIPVVPELVDFLGEVARRRAEPEALPGLAAQIPDNPLVKWLHAVNDPIAGQLRVIAGDLEGDSVGSWLKTLLADAFYWTDNDLVVQTRSMYGGAPRDAGASFVLDQSGEVSHFGYFRNPTTAEAIVSALLQDTPDGFRTIGPLSWAGKSSTGERAALRAHGDGRPATDKPAVFLLPGILGSNLKVNGDRIWLGWRMINGLQRLKYDPRRKDGVQSDGPIDLTYDDLADFLSRTHEVIEFAYDWRRPMEEEARRLGAAVQAAHAARATSAKPVRIVAHSMGGVLARTMQLECPEIWESMLSRAGARILMLGTPNAGSWAPMQVLSADDTFGNLLVAFGAPFQDKAAREMMAAFPGFLQLQAGLLDDKLGLGKTETWQRLADEDLQRVRERSWWHRLKLQLAPYTWGVPSQEVLEQGIALRKRLDEQRETKLGRFADRMMLVVGKARFTPDGFELGKQGLVYLDTHEDGDGRVTLQSAQLPGVRTWQLDCAHGDLPDKQEAFDAYLELLENGSTGKLKTMPAQRSKPMAIAHVRSRPSRARAEGRPPQHPAELLVPASQAQERAPGRQPEAALQITVYNGDLSFVQLPLLLGHYGSMRLTGTEAVMDRLIGETMSLSLKAGHYPGAPGSNQIFLNNRAPRDQPLQLPRPAAVIVIGLGPEGELRGSELVHSVRQGVIAWAQREAEKRAGASAVFDIAATLIGSGGTNIGVGQSARLIVQGVREANQRLADAGWPRVRHLHLIELYLDRASEAWRALRLQESGPPTYLRVTETIQAGVGGLVRPIDPGYRGAEYDLMTAVTRAGASGESWIEYSLDTKRARSEVRAQITQNRLIRAMVKTASNSRMDDPEIGNTLCRLLIPLELDAFLAGASELVLQVDGSTADIPWELLDMDAPGGGERRQWAIRSKLLRKLRTADFRAQVTDAGADAHVLVIGEPQCDQTIYPPLPGAREEAKAVFDLLSSHAALGPERVHSLISSEDPPTLGPDAQAVISALFDRKRNWRIVHIAAHGEPPEKLGEEPKTADDPPQRTGDPRGVVLSDNTFLSPREIRNMRVVPELVFVNCCHLAASDKDQLFRQAELHLGGPYDRARFASGVAQELINVGVRCVIAAGWAVNDHAAKVFALSFYQAILRGERFIDAVARARTDAFHPQDKTWAAYQCYGDPDWVFQRVGGDPQRPSAQLPEEFAGVASPLGLILALRTLAVRSRYQGAPARLQNEKISHLEARFGGLWGGKGAVAEAFGEALNEADEVARAIAWYRRALAAEDGEASLKSAEQLGNLLSRLAERQVQEAREKRDRMKREAGEVPRPRGRGKDEREANSPAKRKLAAAERDLGAAILQGRQGIKEAIPLLERVVELEPTLERYSLLGSVYKRHSMIASIDGKSREKTRALNQMRIYYGRAERLGRQGKLANIFYPEMNRLAAELLLNAGKRGGGLNTVDLEALRRSLDAKASSDADFWSVASLTELRVYEAIGRGHLAAKRRSIEREFEDLHLRARATSMWSSVYDQARFVLVNYATQASPTKRGARKRKAREREAREREAADALLKTLATYATGPEET